VRSLANVAIIVPNSELITNNVVNWSHEDPRIRLSIPVGVSYDSDEDVVISSLMEVASEHADVLATPVPTVRLNSFGDSSWDMELLVWLGGPERWRDIRSELNIEVVRTFRAHGVEIPFPQRDLHLRSPLPIPLDQPDTGPAAARP
jgi:small-conductance mechanosensitive channel